MVGESHAEPLIDPLLVSNFVHQIINPLNGVVGTLDNILDGTVRLDRQHQRLEQVRAQLEHAIELVRNLAFLSQISLGEAGKLILSEKASDVVIPKVIIQAANIFQEVAKSGTIEIRLTDDKTQYVVKGHEALLRQVFMNLFDNAVKYSDRETNVTVTPHANKKKELLIDVENQGIPIENEERERIFERGYRSKAAKDMRASGTGLGLFICRRILEDAHGASIEAEYSRKTGKTLFRVRFRSYGLGEPRKDM